MANIAIPEGALSGGLDPQAPASGTAFESVSRSTAPRGCVIGVPRDAEGMIVVLDVTAATSANTATVTISGVDRASGKIWTILASAAKTSPTTTVLRVSPNITASANLIAQDLIPAEVQIDVAHSDGNPITYSVSVHFCS